jgi:hypothetical protein
MSSTYDDSHSKHKTVIEIVKREDGTFDLFLNHKLDQTQTQERWLAERLCVRFGFCGEEYASILCEVHSNGKATLLFGHGYIQSAPFVSC